MFGRKPKPIVDFEILFTDGRTFTSKDGTWDEVCRECEIAKLTIHGEVLEGFERYAFSWEAEARATIGVGGRPSKIQTTGTIVAVLAAGIRGDRAHIVRVPRNENAPRISQEIAANRLAFADHVWRKGITPVTPTLVAT